MGHHFVPQRYLSGFRAAGHPAEKPMIWMYDKKRRRTKLVSIKRVAQAPAFYTQEDEVALNHDVEIPGNDVIDKIRNGIGLTNEDRMHLTYYIATMIFRVPNARDKAKKFIEPALTSTVNDVKNTLLRYHEEGKVNTEMLERRMQEVAAFEERAKLKPPDAVVQIMTSPWPFQSALVAIRSMNWRMFRSTGPSYFLTSDNPAFYFEDRGLGHPECEMILPLCSEIILHCGWQRGDDDGLAHPNKQQLVKEFNRRQAYGAKQFLFYHEDAPWIDSVAQIDDTRKLNRINWT